MPSAAQVAYIFERFPSFTQTFCAREVLELQRQGRGLLLFSIKDTTQEDIRHFPKELRDQVITLPQGEALIKEVKKLKASQALPQDIVLTLRHWGEQPDKRRVYEAAWIGWKLQQLGGAQHIHTHFAGLGARTCWWVSRFYAISYSFTGHANDLFCREDLPVNLNRLIKDAALMITVSDFSKKFLAEKFPRWQKKIHRVYNGLDTAYYADVPPLGKTPPMILSVGRLIEKKGFADLIKALALLHKKGVSIPCTIVGEGPLEESLSALIKKENLQEYIHLAGAQSQAQIRTLLEASWLFVLPCVIEKDGGMDNLPTVLMEAMSAGRPCISTYLAGVPEMVFAGETGALVQPGDISTLAEKIETFINKKSRCQKMGSAGREKAETLFAQYNTAKKLWQAWENEGVIKKAGFCSLKYSIKFLLQKSYNKKMRPSKKEQYAQSVFT